MKVLNFGSLNLDYVYQVDHFVMPGETLSASGQSVNAGGKGLNQSIALARAGACVYHAGAIGQGGAMLKELLLRSGVHTDYLAKSDALQGNAMIQVAPSGENCIILFGGSNQSITREQIDETLIHFDAGDYLVLQNEINNLPYIVDRAFEMGMVIVLNPSPYDEKLAAVDFDKISWLLVNEVEARQLSGSEDPEIAWHILHEKYPKLSAVITLGKAGSVAYRGEERIAQNIFPVKAVDTTAAGDTFTGYFISSLIAGKSLQECMQCASAASAISVTRAGAAPSIPVKEEVEELLQR